MERRRAIALGLYFALGFFYAGSLVIALSSTGLGALGVDNNLAFSVAARVAGAVCCAVIVWRLLKLRDRAITLFAAWVLAFGVGLTLLRDSILGDNSTPILWAIALAIVGVHVYGAVLVSSSAAPSNNALEQTRGR
jgi:hypothetical protein